MNEFEQFIVANYPNLKPGDEVPDNVLAEASAAFRRSKSTVQNIDPAANNFDLDASIPAPQQSPATTATAPQNEPNPLSGTPFDYKSSRSVLEELYLDTQLKEDLFKGAKFGDDKTAVVGHYDNKLKDYYAPRLAEAGVSLGQAVAGVNAALKQGKSVDEVFAGAPTATNDPATLDDRIAKSAYNLERLLGTDSLNENSPEVKLERENMKRLQSERLGIKETPEGLFMDAETKLQMIPAFAAKKRPFEGRDDYDNISAEIDDIRLAAGMEALRNNSPMFLNLNTYARTKDGRLTTSAEEQYKKDAAEAKKLYGRVVVFDGQNFNMLGRGDGEMPATPEEVTETAASVEGPDSAKAAAQALRKVGQATGMEDPPHIYAAKMYERYVGKPFTDAAWPWVRTFLQELNQPAGR
jgi:hypothetical protein